MIGNTAESPKGWNRHVVQIHDLRHMEHLVDEYSTRRGANQHEERLILPRPAGSETVQRVETLKFLVENVSFICF